MTSSVSTPRTGLLLRRRLPAWPEHMPELASSVEAACRQAGTDADTAHDLRLVVEEACVNIARHGYPGRAPGEVELRVERGTLQGRPAWRIELHDDGVAFDPLAAAVPDVSLPAQDRAIGGLGIHMIRSLTDRQQYMRDARGNRLVLWKFHKAPAQS